MSSRLSSRAASTAPSNGPQNASSKPVHAAPPAATRSRSASRWDVKPQATHLAKHSSGNAVTRRPRPVGTKRRRLPASGFSAWAPALAESEAARSRSGMQRRAAGCSAR